MDLARKVAVNTALLVVGRIMVVIGGVLSVAFASRYLGLDEYGALTTAFAYVALFEILTDLGVFTMASREIAQRPGEERRIVGNVAGLTAAVSVVVIAVAWGLALLVYPGGGNNADIREGIAILLVQLAMAAPIGAARAHFVANQRAYLAALGEVSQAVVTVLVTAAALVFDWGFAGVMAGLASGRVAQAIVMWAAMSRGVRGAFAVDLAYWRRLLTLALPLGATMIINYLYFRFDVLLLGWLRDPEDVAIYGLAYKVIEAFIVLPSYFMITLFPEIAKMDAASDRLRDLVGQALSVMELLALPILIGALVLAEPIVVIVGGDDYAGAASVLRILMFGLAISFLNGVYGNALVALGRQSRLFYLSLLVFAVNIAMNLVLIPVWGVEGAAIAVSISEVIAFVVVRELYRRAARLPERQIQVRVVLAALVMGASIVWAPFVDWSPAAVVVSATSVAVVVYAGAVLALRAVPEVIDTQLLQPMLARIRNR